FSGIDLSSRDAACIASIRKVRDLSPLPVLVTAVLGSDWRTASHYQTMNRLEARDDGAPFRVRVYAAAPTPELTRSMLSASAGALVRSRVAAESAPAGLIVDGAPESGYAYLMESRERAVARGTCAVADGELVGGGMSFGIIRDGQWEQQLHIVRQGRFVAAAC